MSESTSAGTSAKSTRLQALPKKAGPRLPFPIFALDHKELELTPEQEKNIRDAFILFDADGSGQISSKEWRYAMKSLGYSATKEEVAKIFNDIDEDGSGLIEYPEFHHLLKQKIKDKLIREEMMKAFLLFDKEEKGGITLKDLRQAVVESREHFSDPEIYGMLEEADKDSDGIVVVSDFLRVMKKAGIW